MNASITGILAIILSLIVMALSYFGLSGAADSVQHFMNDLTGGYESVTEETQPSDDYVGEGIPEDYQILPENEESEPDAEAIEDEIQVVDQNEAVEIISVPATDTVFFGNGYSIELPQGVVFTESDDANGYFMEGVHEETGTEIGIYEMQLSMSLEDLFDLYSQTFEDTQLIETEALSYVTVYDPDDHMDMCLFEDSDSGSIYMIVFSRKGEETVAYDCFASIRKAAE